MNPITLEWVRKAEGDIATAKREMEASGERNLDAVCFHAQQCAEKYLKGLLQEKGIAFTKTHNLLILLELILPLDSSWDDMRLELERLTEYAVYVRYPGYFADEDKAKDALDIALSVRSRTRKILGLGEND